jgi:hypothetical protein
MQLASFAPAAQWSPYSNKAAEAKTNEFFLSF